MSDARFAEVLGSMVDVLDQLVSMTATFTGANDAFSGRSYEPGSGAIIAELRGKLLDVRKLLDEAS